jgi:glycogen debranching enzyme
MARPLEHDALSLTAAGVGFVTDRSGDVRPDAVAGLIVDDRRALSRWELRVDGADARRIGWERRSASADHILCTLSAEGVIDPIAVLERERCIDGRGLRERCRITAYAQPLRLRLTLVAERDDQTVLELGDPAPPAPRPVASASGLLLPGVDDAPDVEIVADGWRVTDDGTLVVDAHVDAGTTWSTEVTAVVADGRPERPWSAPSSGTITTEPPLLGRAVHGARADLRGLTMPVGDRDVLAAGSPFFLALFGRDSMIAGVQFLLDSHRPLLDVLATLAEHQATVFDAVTQAEPGRILHELRLGRAGVFGVAPGTPYYGAVDTSALFVVALGEAARWGAARNEVAALLPAARAALDWCERHGDVDGDGFIESVPHPSGLTNLGWKDSSDSIIDASGRVIVERVALAEVQAYWYRALRTLAELERWTGNGDGAERDRAAAELADRFVTAFAYDTDDGPFVGLALDGQKRLLRVRASNAGHVLWTGILPAAIADPVASQLAGPDMFSGWGVRTVGADAAGYNPFGYHRGSVWPHDTAIAMHGAARIGRDDVVERLGEGLLALGAAVGGQLPELLSGISRAEIEVPVPYAAACRPQAWAAGAIMMATRAMLGLEPDAPSRRLRLRPCLPDATTMHVHDLPLGDDRISFTVTGREVTHVDAPGWDVVIGDGAVFAAGPWGAR